MPRTSGYDSLEILNRRRQTGTKIKCGNYVNYLKDYVILARAKNLILDPVNIFLIAITEIKNRMIQEEYKKNAKNVCNISYLSEMMGGKKQLIREIMDVFLNQVPEELQSINNAVMKTDYAAIKRFAHSMKSTVSVMGISILTPVLQEIEDLGSTEKDINKIKKLNQELNVICKQAMEEIEREKLNYA